MMTVIMISTLFTFSILFSLILAEADVMIRFQERFGAGSDPHLQSEERFVSFIPGFLLSIKIFWSVSVLCIWLSFC